MNRARRKTCGASHVEIAIALLKTDEERYFNVNTGNVCYAY